MSCRKRSGLVTETSKLLECRWYLIPKETKWGHPGSESWIKGENIQGSNLGNLQNYDWKMVY